MADRIVIAGGTGFLGRHVAAHLAGLGREVVVLARHRPAREPAGRFVGWDARSLGPWAEELDGAAALINLAGRTVDCVKTPDHCDEILRSRVESTLVLGRALRQADNPPRAWVQMSTAHIYGDPPEAVCDEESPTGWGLAPFVGRAWEDALARAVPDGVRTVVLRTSFVLGHDGGAVPRMVRLSILAMVVLSIVAVLHLLRVVFGLPITVGDVAIPQWVSVLGFLVPGAIVFLLWRERRTSS